MWHCLQSEKIPKGGWSILKRVNFPLKKVRTSCISHPVILLSSPTFMDFSPPFLLLIATNSPNSIWIMKMQRSLKTSNQAIVSFHFCAAPYNWLQNSFPLIKLTKSSFRRVFLSAPPTATTNPCPSMATWGTVGYLYTERVSICSDEWVHQTETNVLLLFALIHNTHFPLIRLWSIWYLHQSLSISSQLPPCVFNCSWPWELECSDRSGLVENSQR